MALMRIALILHTYMEPPVGFTKLWKLALSLDAKVTYSSLLPTFSILPPGKKVVVSNALNVWIVLVLIRNLSTEKLEL